MKKDIRVKIIDVFGAVSSLAVIFFFFTLWLFSYNSIDQPLKEAWTSTISFLSVLATLAAAYIAAHLFNDWREQNNHTIKAHQSNLVMESYRNLNNLSKEIVHKALLIKAMVINQMNSNSIDDEITVLQEYSRKHISAFDDLHLSVVSFSNSIENKNELLALLQNHEQDQHIIFEAINNISSNSGQKLLTKDLESAAEIAMKHSTAIFVVLIKKVLNEARAR
ncbi:hypothetical protein [Acinetobacter radioresistens]|uniref:hypothetical protein n=1 Tax=Acinetobacter radioresistens TaxID=40216 RepID=UPI001250B7DD|nr:hypothetical protein [Acinetobacter radioresistens]